MKVLIMIKKIIPSLLIIAGVISFVFVACAPERREEATDLLSDKMIADDMEMSDQAVGEMITSVPNPVEMSVLLQRSNVVYSQELLNPTSNISNYNTNFERAINLGVYGTDLVYMNIYDRTVATLSYLRNVRNLAEDLRIGQFFDYETLNRLSESSRNVDSVLYITNRGFDSMTQYLINQGRSSIAVLIAYGTWIESIHIATNVKTMPPNKDLIHQRIGEQKIVLDNILLLMSNYRDDPRFDELFLDLLDLKKEFDKVTIQYIYAEPEVKEVNGARVVIDNSSSEVFITEEIIEGIAQQVEYIRNKIVE